VLEDFVWRVGPGKTGNRTGDVLYGFDLDTMISLWFADGGAKRAYCVHCEMTKRDARVQLGCCKALLSFAMPPKFWEGN
jgi:hypothetical protein